MHLHCPSTKRASPFTWRLREHTHMRPLSAMFIAQVLASGVLFGTLVSEVFAQFLQPAGTSAFVAPFLALSATPPGGGGDKAGNSPPPSPLGSEKDPWLPSLDLTIPESHDTRIGVYDVLKGVENTPNDNLLFAVARDVFNTYQMTKPFLDEFIRVNQQQRAKNRSRNSRASVEGAPGSSSGITAAAESSTTWEIEASADHEGRKKSHKKEERQNKKQHERKKNADRSTHSAGTDEDAPQNTRLFGTIGSWFSSSV
ncbi:transmembrane protein [Cystoisospora suis]|uniref:Transmembrane protein n=1 Tax=Cystoisospora suis TaxID=483139 RepID=A0A2C6L767_9APIC|nr:transmembrane protein [Cystoisospora suis]